MDRSNADTSIPSNPQSHRSSRANRAAWAPAVIAVALAVMAPTCTPTRQIVNPPTYLGSNVGSKECRSSYRTVGFEPDDSQVAVEQRHKWPLFIYLVGTGDAPDTPVAMSILQAMAARGFVSLAAQYDNSYPTLLLGDKKNVGHCLFNPALYSQSLVDVACRLPNVDCGDGVAVWGHSLGGQLAIHSRDEDTRVQAVIAAGVGPSVKPYTLATDKLRVLNGANDGTQNTPAVLGDITDARAPASCATSSTQCLRTNGSGWVIVQASSGITPDHCWFRNRGCSTQDPASGFVDPSPTVPYTLASNADWLQSMVVRYVQSK